LFVADCDTSENATDLVILDWSGGRNNLYPDDEFAGLDFSSFETLDGGTLADAALAFKDAVRDEVVRILCDLPFVSVVVQNDKAQINSVATTIYIVQASSRRGGGQIGEGEYDPCNLRRDNSALVFGDELLNFPDLYSFEEWVLIFANVAAHEIGHTLGFGHVPRSQNSEAEHALYVELMLAGHTIDEMVRHQRFLSDDTNCPEEAARARLHMNPPTIACGLTE